MSHQKTLSVWFYYLFLLIIVVFALLCAWANVIFLLYLVCLAGANILHIQVVSAFWLWIFSFIGWGLTLSSVYATKHCANELFKYRAT